MTIVLGLILTVATPPAAAAETAQSVTGLATSLFYAGRPAEGAGLLEEMLPRLERAGLDRAGAVRLQIEHARMVHYATSQSGSRDEKAVGLSAAALAAAEATARETLVADAADLHGLTLYWKAFQSGDFGAPAPFYARALATRRKQGDRRGIAETLFHQGLLFQNRPEATAEDEKKAEALFLEAKAQLGGDHPVELSYLERHLAAIAQARGDLDGALAAFRRSLELREQAGFKIYIPPARLALGEVLLAKGDRGGAAEQYRRAIEEAEAVGGHRFVIDGHRALGEMAASGGDGAGAREHFQAAMAAARAAANEAEAAELLQRMQQLR